MPIYASDYDHSKRPFGREKPLHAILGGGKVADIVLWRNKNLSAAVLVGSSIIWFLFQVVEYSFVTLLCHVSMVVMMALFIWSATAGLIHGNMPDPRAITIPESTFRWLYAKINTALLRFYDVSSGKDFKTFVLVMAFLWILSGIGNYFSSLDLLYTGILCLLTLPALYERYQHEVDYLAAWGNQDMKKLYRKMNSRFLNKIPRGPSKQKTRRF